MSQMVMINLNDAVECIDRLTAGGGVTSPDDMVYIDDAQDALKRCKRYAYNQPKEGVWMYQTFVGKYTGRPEREYFCSQCKKTLTKRVMPTRFCSNCGASMSDSFVEVG